MRPVTMASRCPAPKSPFATVEEAIEDIREGRFVVVVDDEDRENEGDLTIAAQFATPEAVNFMVTHARGLICLCLTDERCDELGLRQMTDQNETPFGTAFTVSVEAREGVTTGISAQDRAHTIQVAIDPSSTAGRTSSSPATSSRCARAPAACSSARADRGGRRSRAARGLIPAGVVCEIMNDDGTMARVPDLDRVLRRARAEDDHRRRPDRVPPRAEKLVERVASVRLPTDLRRVHGASPSARR